ESRREGMGFLQAHGLSVYVRELDEDRIDLRNAPEPIVDGVVCGEGIRAGDRVVKAHQAKIFANALERICETRGRAVRSVGTSGRRPESVGISHHRLLQTGTGRAVWQKTEAGFGAGHNGEVASRLALPKPFVVPEQE